MSSAVRWPLAVLEVTGSCGGVPVSYGWEDGRLTADPGAARAIPESLVRACEEVGEPGGVRGPATLAADRPLELVVATLTAGLDAVESIVGRPPPERLPDGAVA